MFLSVHGDAEASFSSDAAGLRGYAECRLTAICCRTPSWPQNQSYGFSTCNPSMGVKCWRFRVANRRLYQGCRGDEGIGKTSLVVPSNLPPAPRNGIIEVNERKQGQ